MAKSIPVFTKAVEVRDFMQDKWSWTGFAKNHFIMAAFTAYAILFSVLELFQSERHFLFSAPFIILTFAAGLMFGATLKQRNFEGLKPNLSNRAVDLAKIIVGSLILLDYFCTLLFKTSILFADYRYSFFFNLIPIISLAFVGHGIRSMQLFKFNEKIVTYNKLKKHDIDYNTEVKAYVFYQDSEYIYNPPVKAAPEQAPAFDAAKYKQDLLDAINVNTEAPIVVAPPSNVDNTMISTPSSSLKKEDDTISLDTQRRIAELEQQRNAILNKQP